MIDILPYQQEECVRIIIQNHVTKDYFVSLKETIPYDHLDDFIKELERCKKQIKDERNNS